MPTEVVTVDELLALVADFGNNRMRAIGADDDKDGRVDRFENCPKVANAGQADTDRDGTGDACDDDRDGDGVANGSDNCASVPNTDQRDSNADGVGDACDPTPLPPPPPPPPAEQTAATPNASTSAPLTTSLQAPSLT